MNYVYLDQNLLSWADEKAFVDLVNLLKIKELYPVISFHHMTEIARSPKWELFINRLEEIRPAFLSSASIESINESGVLEVSSFAAESQIRWHKENMAEIEASYLGALAPLLKIVGGLDDFSREDIEEAFIGSMRSSVDAILSSDADAAEFAGHELKGMLAHAEKLIRQDFANIEFSHELTRLADMRRRVSTLGDTSQIPSDGLIEKVLGTLDMAEQNDLSKSHPPGFAAISPKTRHELIQTFSLIISSIGGVPGFGKVRRGNPKKQMDRFRALFLDALHIGLASHFSAFITNDRAAFLLAKAIYSYAQAPAKAYFIDRQANGKFSWTIS